MTSINLSGPAFKKSRRQYLRSTSNRDTNFNLDWTPFRVAEKRYKARFPPPDLSDVLDLATLDYSRSDECSRGGWFGRSDAVEIRRTALKSSDDTGATFTPKEAYVVRRMPGLVLLPSFVSLEEQRTLVRWSIQDQARNPNQTNLDAHYVLPEQGLWNLYLQCRKTPSQDVPIQTRKTSSVLEPQACNETPGPRKLVDNTPADPSNFESLSAIPKPPPPTSTTVQPLSPSSLIYKLRWANIGWYYHWGSKQYDFTKGKGEIDERIRDVCKRAVAMVDWNVVFGGSGPGREDWVNGDWRMWNETYEPDAGIVNFYQTKDTLMAHVDRSEVCATSPLVSISLGNAAIFLIGGLTRDVEPVPILLRSGDVVIMSGPVCRRSYHGVPRILENTLPPHFEDKDGDTEWEYYMQYLRTTRININVRQVFPKGFVPNLG